MYSFEDLKTFLDRSADQYNHSTYIDDDPIQIPHLFSKKEDIEISGFLVSCIAWGQRKSIITSGLKMVKLLDNSPHDWILNSSEIETETVQKFVHRTFNDFDFKFFVRSLRNIYLHHLGLENVFSAPILGGKGVYDALLHFRKIFFEIPAPTHTYKHIPDVSKGSAAKRMNMFLRWMVRSDTRKVDFGIWKNIPMSKLMMPLDVHCGNVARKLGIITRKQNDWAALEEMMNILRKMRPEDPVFYDYALFGLGVFEGFGK